MKQTLLLFLLLFSIKFYAQEYVFGKVVSEQHSLMPNVLVVNTKTDEQTYTDGEGNFRIRAKNNEEIRFVKDKYDRVAYHMAPSDFRRAITIIMIRTPEEIQEVVVRPKLTGNLSEDSKNLAGNDKIEALQNNIGVPRPPEKPREKPADISKNVLLPLLVGSLNVQALYDVISGKSKRQKRLYKYDDLQDDIVWVRKKVDINYFINLGIPEDKISEFITFAFFMNPKSLKYVKANNLSGFLVEIENPALEFKEKLNKKLK